MPSSDPIGLNACEVQPAGSGRFVAHAEDIGIRTGFEERESAGEDEVGDQEWKVEAGFAGRDKHQRTACIKGETDQDSRFV